jgi:non-ribosomal peptide synthetase component F
VVFVLQNIEIPAIQLGDLAISGYPMQTGTAQFDLVMEINEQPGNWPVKLEYNTALFEAETILLMQERLLALLQDILANPARTIGEFSYRIAAETEHAPDKLDFAFNF